MLLTRLSNENKKYYLNLALCLADVDGNFSDLERKLIDSQCAEMGIDNNDYKTEMTIKDVCNIIKTSMSNAEKKIVFIELASLALVDDEFDESEKKFVEQVRILLEIPKEVAYQAVDIMIKIISFTKKLEDYVEW